MWHKELPPSERHAVHAFEYADEAERLGATGLTSSDEGKVAWQKDNDELFILVATSPEPVWEPFTNHQHANKSTLDKITEDAGLPLWNGGAWPGGGGGVSTVTTPTITAPTNAQIDFDGEMVFSAYATEDGFYGPHDKTWVQIASDNTFTTLVVDEVINTPETTYSFTGWTPLTEYWVRVRYGSDNHWSQWADAHSFTTADGYIAQPTLTVQGSPSDVPGIPTLETSAFATIGGTDTHLNTDWQILDDQLQVVWESLADSVNKLSVAVPSGILTESTEYTFRARHRGEAYGESGWASVVATTEAEFFVFEPSSAGLPFGGGFYAGANIIVDGQEYAIVVAPRSQGGLSTTGLEWKTANTSTSGTDSLNDGWSNSNAMNNSSHPAAQFCRGLNINGHNDWYLPSRDELEICYRYLKPTTAETTTNTINPDGPGVNNNSNPVGTAYTSSDPTQTSISIFQEGGGEDFPLDHMVPYSSSTQNSSTRAWFQFFGNGRQGDRDKANPFWVRAVRRIAI